MCYQLSNMSYDQLEELETRVLWLETQLIEAKVEYSRMRMQLSPKYFILHKGKWWGQCTLQEHHRQQKRFDEEDLRVEALQEAENERYQREQEATRVDEDSDCPPEVDSDWDQKEEAD